jgi:hypothetical protein
LATDRSASTNLHVGRSLLRFANAADSAIAAAEGPVPFKASPFILADVVSPSGNSSVPALLACALEVAVLPLNADNADFLPFLFPVAELSIPIEASLSAAKICLSDFTRLFAFLV